MAVSLAAADIWDTKPFTEWSNKDVEKVMTDSPWAGKASITHARAGANLGPVPDWKLTVSVRSALPYRQALARQQMGPGGAVPDGVAADLAQDNPLYIIAIAGIPRMFSAQATAIVNAALLKRDGKEPLKPAQARLFLFDKDGKPVDQAPPQPVGRAPGGGPGAGAPGAGGRGAGAPGAGGRGAAGGFGGGGFGGGGFGGGLEDKSGITATVMLGYSKEAPITVADGEFEIVTTITTYAIKKTFKLKDMVVNGTLAL